MKELIAIQSELKVPKDLFNNFGKFNYRSAEGILEALKPLLKKHNCFVTLTDEVKGGVEGGRYYIQATAIITNGEGKQVGVSALAREAETQKGMNDAQITGSTSSYARKYALGGLFLLDDSKDSDDPAYDKRKDNDQDDYNQDTHESIIETQLGGRNLTQEASHCKTLQELQVWYNNLPSEMKKAGSPAVGVKNDRKEELLREQKTTQQPAEEKVAPEEFKPTEYTFEQLKEMKIVQLKDIAGKKGVRNAGKMSKGDLVNAILKAINQ